MVDGTPNWLLSLLPRQVRQSHGSYNNEEGCLHLIDDETSYPSPLARGNGRFIGEGPIDKVHQESRPMQSQSQRLVDSSTTIQPGWIFL
jgi:hypothetical protein